MKKLISIVALLAVATPAFADSKAARPSYLTRNAKGGFEVTYNYADKVKSGWYASVRGGASFLTWKNKYSSDSPTIDAEAGSDDYSFEPVFTWNVAFGKRINYFWRVELEGGFVNKFTDEDEGYKFALSVPYVVANGYYDFENGLYVGGGLGMSFTTTELADDAFVSGGGKKTAAAPMAALMAGLTHKLDDNLVLDVRYRIAGYAGTEQKREWVAGTELGGLDVGGKHLKNTIGMILDNSFTIGLRYEF